MGTGSHLSRSMVAVVTAVVLLGALDGAARTGAGAPSLRTHRAAALPGHGPVSPLAPCTDKAFVFENSKWATTFRWSFHANSTPAGVGLAAAEAALRRAAANIVHGRNDCGLPDRVAATQRYLGRSSSGPNIRGDGTCGSPDSKSVIGFGKLPVTQIGLTCWWTREGTAVEADTKLNKAVFEWVARIRLSCFNSWSIEGVATHELGHTFGLDHVTESVHGMLTMSPLILPCQKSEATLGLGDVRGLRTKY